MAKLTKNIVLVGPMGSGKTSVGRRLACVLKRDFFDTDFEIVARTGYLGVHIPLSSILRRTMDRQVVLFYHDTTDIFLLEIIAVDLPVC
jgi:shikimate kinase